MSDSRAQFGAVLHLRARPGRRSDVVSLLRNYVTTLDGEPGTVLFAVALDPADDDAIWLWEQFADAGAVAAHFRHDFFRALQLEMADLLAQPAAARLLTPVVHRVSSGVPTE